MFKFICKPNPWEQFKLTKCIQLYNWTQSHFYVQPFHTCISGGLIWVRDCPSPNPAWSCCREGAHLISISTYRKMLSVVMVRLLVDTTGTAQLSNCMARWKELNNVVLLQLPNPVPGELWCGFLVGQPWYNRELCEMCDFCRIT